jgi:hypothetical protein
MMAPASSLFLRDSSSVAICSEAVSGGREETKAAEAQFGESLPRRGQVAGIAEVLIVLVLSVQIACEFTPRM